MSLIRMKSLLKAKVKSLLNAEVNESHKQPVGCLVNEFGLSLAPKVLYLVTLVGYPMMVSVGFALCNNMIMFS